MVTIGYELYHSEGSKYAFPFGRGKKRRTKKSVDDIAISILRYHGLPLTENNKKRASELVVRNIEKGRREGLTKDQIANNIVKEADDSIGKSKSAARGKGYKIVDAGTGKIEVESHTRGGKQVKAHSRGG